MTAADYYDHPVFHPNRLRLATPALDLLRQSLRQWLWTGATGGVVLGDARTGKTTALWMLVGDLHTRGHVKVPVDYVGIPTRDKASILSVFRQLNWSAGLRVTHTDRADHLSDQFMHYIADQTVDSHCDQAILFVDEMQRLQPQQFNAFAELHDKLLKLGIVLLTVFVGNTQESSSLLKRVAQPAFAHIRGRFFSQHCTFMGLQSKADVEACLSQYDRLRHPADGPTYTAHFLPEAVRAGWRLASTSTVLWRAFHAHQVELKTRSWGMQYFIATVQALLADMLPEHGVDSFDDDMANAAIEVSELVPSLVTAPA